MALRTISKSIDLNSSSNKYITDINNNGIQIHSSNYNASQYTENITMNPQGIQLNYGNLSAMELTKNSLVFNEVDTTNNTSTRTAIFGENTQIGRDGKYRTTINEKGIKLITDANVPALDVGPGSTEQPMHVQINFTDDIHSFEANTQTVIDISDQLSQISDGSSFSVKLYRKWHSKGIEVPSGYTASGTTTFNFTVGISEELEYFATFSQHNAKVLQRISYDNTNETLTVSFPSEYIVDDDSYVMYEWYLFDFAAESLTTVPHVDINSEFDVHLESEDGNTSRILLDKDGVKINSLKDRCALSVSNTGTTKTSWELLNNMSALRICLTTTDESSYRSLPYPVTNVLTGTAFQVKITVSNYSYSPVSSGSSVWESTLLGTPTDYVWTFTKGIQPDSPVTKNIIGRTATSASSKSIPITISYDGNNTITYTKPSGYGIFNSVRKKLSSKICYFSEVTCALSGTINTYVPSVSLYGVVDIGNYMRFDDPRSTFVVDDNWTWSPNMTQSSGNESNTTFTVSKNDGNFYWPLFIADFNRKNGTGGSGVSNWCCGAMFLSDRSVNKATVYIKGNAAGGNITKINAGVKILWLKLTHDDIYNSQSDIANS